MSVLAVQKEKRHSKGQYKQRKCDCGKEKDHQRMRVITDYRARDSCYAEARVQDSAVKRSIRFPARPL